jgi:chaperonin cofactor prefoldin
MTVVTESVIEQQKERLKASVIEMHRRIHRSEEGISSTLRDIEQVDIEISAQNNNDREIRRIIEERYSSSIAQLSEHVERLEMKCRDKIDVNNMLKRRRYAIQGMIQELFTKRTDADP